MLSFLSRHASKEVAGESLGGVGKRRIDVNVELEKRRKQLPRNDGELTF